MDWAPIANTLVGGLIGVSASLVSDRVRWNRDQSSSASIVRRTAYSEYLAALAAARNELRIVAQSPDLTPPERQARAREALASKEVYEHRYSVALVAPGQVIEASSVAIRSLRDLRDCVSRGGLHGQSEYLQVRDEYEESFQRLLRQMRRDTRLALNRRLSAHEDPP